MSTASTPSHILVHRYTPGTGPQEGSPELEAEMEVWDRIDKELRSTGQLVSGWALSDPSTTIGKPAEPTTSQTIFAIHALSAASDTEAESIAARMPHLEYGSTEIRKLMV